MVALRLTSRESRENLETMESRVRLAHQGKMVRTVLTVPKEIRENKVKVGSQEVTDKRERMEHLENRALKENEVLKDLLVRQEVPVLMELTVTQVLRESKVNLEIRVW